MGQKEEYKVGCSPPSPLRYGLCIFIATSIQHFLPCSTRVELCLTRVRVASVVPRQMRQGGLIHTCRSSCALSGIRISSMYARKMCEQWTTFCRNQITQQHGPQKLPTINRWKIIISCWKQSSLFIFRIRVVRAKHVWTIDEVPPHENHAAAWPPKTNYLPALLVDEKHIFRAENGVNYLFSEFGWTNETLTKYLLLIDEYEIFCTGNRVNYLLSEFGETKS